MNSDTVKMDEVISMFQYCQQNIGQLDEDVTGIAVRFMLKLAQEVQVIKEHLQEAEDKNNEM